MECVLSRPPRVTKSLRDTAWEHEFEGSKVQNSWNSCTQKIKISKKEESKKSIAKVSKGLEDLEKLRQWNEPPRIP